MLEDATYARVTGNSSIRGYLHHYGAMLVLFVAVVDIAIIIGVLAYALKSLGLSWSKDYLVALTVVLAIFLVITVTHTFYRAHRMTGIFREILHLLFFWFISVGFMNTLLFVFDGLVNVRQEVVAMWILGSSLGLMMSRLVIRSIAHYLRKKGHNVRFAAIVGATETGLRIHHAMTTNRWMGFSFCGFYDARSKSRCQEDKRFSALEVGALDDLFDRIQRGEVHVVFIALPMGAQKRISALIDRLCTTSVSTYYAPDFDTFGLLHARWGELGGQPVISIVETPFIGNLNLLKRLEDVLLSAVALMVLMLPMALIALLIRLDSPGPVLYKQKRYGLDGRPFVIYKFRSMHSSPHDGKFRQATRSDPRVTGIGRMLRKYSLDELPQLLNVLSGSMSLIGPRPHPIALDDEHKELIRRYSVRFKVKPGITGWAQVNGYRGETDTLDKMEGRIRYDLEYISNWSVGFDLRILLMTFVSVLRPQNAY